MLAFCTVCGTFIVWRIPLWVRQMQSWRTRGTVGFDKSFILSVGPDLTQHAAAISKRDTCGTHRPQNFDTTQTHPPRDPRLTEINPKRKKKRKQNTKRNARKRQHVFYFLCYFSTASASVTSCFFSTSDLWIVAAASVNCLSIVNCPSFGSWRHLEPPHSAPPINMKTNFGHDFLWRRWWRGSLNLTFHVSSCFALFSYSLMTNVSVLLMRRAEKIKPHLIATQRLMTLVLIYDQKSCSM